MMRSGGHRRSNFRGTVESPFLRHRFTDPRTDALLPSLREAAAALCRAADRETLIRVVELLQGADPRNKQGARARLAALQLAGADEPAVEELAALQQTPAPPMPAPPPRNQERAAREARALRDRPPPPPESPSRGSITSFLGEAASTISEAANSLLRTPSVEARHLPPDEYSQELAPPDAPTEPSPDKYKRRVDALIKRVRSSEDLRKAASQPSLSQLDDASLSPASPQRPVLSASCAMLQQLSQAPARVKLGLDLGGSLTKLVIATPLEESDTPTTPRPSRERLRVACDVGGVRTRLQFVSAATDELEEVLAALGCSDDEADDEERRSFKRASRRIVAAGGGAHKLRRTFRSALGIELTPFREMQSIVDGLLLLHELNVPDEVYTASGSNQNFELDVRDDDAFKMNERVAQWPQPLLPLLLVNVGSGVSCLVVNREGYARVGGTALGGASFLGLARALTAATTYREALALAARGDASMVDTLVEDIYGSTGCVDLGLPPYLTAASFGKLARSGNRSARDADVCRALLEMVAQSCCVLARAHAAQLGCRQRVFFAGGFLDENPLARATIANSLKSLGGRAHFLRHSDFLGALGATAHALDHQHAVPVSQLPVNPAHPSEPWAPTRRAPAHPPPPEAWSPGHSPPPRRRSSEDAEEAA